MRPDAPLSNIRVLVTDGEGKPALAAVRSLARAGATVDVLAESPWAVSFASRYCGRRIVTGPEDDSQGWVEIAADAVKRGDYDAILLCGDAAAAHVSEHRERFEPYTRILLPDKNVVRIGLNKAHTLRLAQQAGVPVPRTLFPSHADDVIRLAETIAYPVVVKGATGSGSQQVRYASNRNELVQRYREVADMSDGTDLPLVQELVQGEGLGYAGLFSDGQVLAQFMWRRIREYPLSGGPSAIAESIDDPRLAEHGLAMIRALRWSGVAMVEFKRDLRDGTPRLMEINPRLWGSVELSVRCGVDVPRLYVEACLGRPQADAAPYEVGRRMAFLFPDALLLAAASSRDALRLLAGIALPSRSFDVCLDDLKTLPRQLGSAYQAIRKRVRNRTL
jgi:predicted ATP-grasp superfamily ATP-dependent carboligase